MRMLAAAALLIASPTLASFKYQPAQEMTNSQLVQQSVSVCNSANIENAPAFVGPVTDGAALFDAKQKLNLENRIVKFETENTEKLVVVTVKSLLDQDISAYTCTLFNSWGIGDSVRNDGIAILIAPNERKVRIAVGYGLEDILSNAFLGQVIQTKILPEFKKGDFEAGVSNAISAISEELRGK